MSAAELNPHDRVVKDKALQLFTYLYELSGLRTRVIRIVDQYEELIWLDRLADIPGCYCIATASVPDESTQSLDEWIRLVKPKTSKPPDPPNELRSWINPDEIDNPFSESPALADAIPAERDERLVVAEESLPEAGYLESPEIPAGIQVAWNKYIQTMWKPWAMQERPIRKAQEIYTTLFSIHQRQQRLGEEYEVIMGVGLLTWLIPEAQRVRRHILVAQAFVDFDIDTGTISVGPAPEGAEPMLEQDMLDPHQRPDQNTQRRLEQEATALGESLWDSEGLKGLLRAYSYALGAEGRFEDTLIPQSRETSQPLIHFAPALILRRRGERTFQRAFKSILEQIEAGGTIPLGVKRLMVIEDRKDSIAPDLNAGEPPVETWLETEEILFPLAANHEQIEIVAKLSSRDGVVVQGPPGTGKSHTIANIVSHLLANGMRVLVTSHTARALKVLRAKIPAEVSSLCVSLLGNDQESLQALRDSVSGITKDHEAYREERNHQQIESAKEKLDQARREEATILGNLRAIREREIYRHPSRFGDYGGTAKEIALLIREREKTYAWIGIKPGEDEGPPLRNAEAVELLGLARHFAHDAELELDQTAPNPANLIPPKEFAELIAKEKTLRSAHGNLAGSRRFPGYRALLALSDSEREGFLNELVALQEKYRSVASHVLEWTETAAREILADRDRDWRETLDSSTAHIRAAQAILKQGEGLRVTGIEGRDSNAVMQDATELLQYLRKGGKLRSFPFPRTIVREMRYLIQDVRVNGQVCRTQGSLQKLIIHLQLAGHIASLNHIWGELAPSRETTFGRLIAEFLDMCEPLQEALKLHSMLGSLKRRIGRIEGLREPLWHDLADVEALTTAVRAATVGSMLKHVAASISRQIGIVESAIAAGNAHPTAVRVRAALTERDPVAYEESHLRLERLAEMRSIRKRRNHLKSRLAQALPRVAIELAATPQNASWDARMQEFEEAWHWAQADGWLSQIVDPGAGPDLLHRLDLVRKRQRKAILTIASAKALRYCLERLKESERQHLVAWTKAIQRIGKGTGKYAELHRKAAQEHMEGCRGAIPAWIMPLYRLAESVRPGVDSYDVVIIDEASQSGPEALLLHYLAPKIIVVGDDRQISPDNVGINRAAVNELRLTHLKDIPHNDAFGLDGSFFGLAEIRFGGRIGLREHFRCMPEIIQFSNNIAYQADPLIPLRQFGVDRLTPVIVPVHVKDGYQRGSAGRIENLPEAEAVARSVQMCCKDPKYEHKTMGVISLIGDQQAKLIERFLIQSIGTEEMERRGLICGDAYSFQGDERDVMFLSMVSAPAEGVIIHGLAMDRDLRRFNVAASRAKDQMWLFYSATLNDLNPDDLRYKLLEYCLSPSVLPTPFGDVDINALRIRSRNADRQVEEAPEPFDSWFEVDVFLRIAGQGYRVIPQYEVADRRIDLVVEGMKGRMAVECDGDTWHGAEQYEADMARQMELERCGWTFWRVRAGEFYRDPEAALEALWEMLESLEIKPKASRPE